MGLTVHYSLDAPKRWTWDQTSTKLKALHAFSASLPLVSISSQVNQFDADRIKTIADNACRRAEETLEEFEARQDEQGDADWGWFMIQSAQYLESLGRSFRQNPSRIAGFSVFPGYGSEEFNIGICEYAEHTFEPLDLVWKSDRQTNAFNWRRFFVKDSYNYSTAEFKAGRKLANAFMKKWGLKRVGENRKFHGGVYGNASNLPYHIDKLFDIPLTNENGSNAGADAAWVGMVQGNYASHRKGYGPSLPIVAINHSTAYRERGFYMQFKDGEEACHAAAENPEFRKELEDMARGPRVTKPMTRVWSSFCKTQYASSPHCGGVENFMKVHMLIIEILDYAEKLGFKVEVNDEGHWHETRNEDTLLKNIADYNQLIAAFGGAMKDAMGGSGMELQAPIFDYSNFEHLEAKGQGMIEGKLDGLNRIMAYAEAASRNVDTFEQQRIVKGTSETEGSQSDE